MDPKEEVIEVKRELVPNKEQVKDEVIGVKAWIRTHQIPHWKNKKKLLSLLQVMMFEYGMEGPSWTTTIPEAEKLGLYNKYINLRKWKKEQSMLVDAYEDWFHDEDYKWLELWRCVGKDFASLDPEDFLFKVYYAAKKKLRVYFLFFLGKNLGTSLS